MEHINNLKKYKGLLIQLVLRDIKTKYRRSILGLLWDSIKSPADDDCFDGCIFKCV